MKRRDFLIGSASAAIAGGLAGCDDHGASRMPQPPVATTGPDGKPRLPWQNWSGYRHCIPDARVAPANLDEMVSFLKNAKGTVRPVGAGHSFTELVPTDGGTILSLRNFEGLLSHDEAACTATFGAGTKLGNVGEPLNAIGQALPNMPEIDQQTLAGAMSTGTHSLSIAAPPVSFWPAARFNAYTAPARGPVTWMSVVPSVIEPWMYDMAEYATLSLALTVVPSILVKPRLPPTKAA